MKTASVIAGLAAAVVLVTASAGASIPKGHDISRGDVFAPCRLGSDPPFGGLNYPDAEVVEPWVAADPTGNGHLVGDWEQDRWSDGGAKGLVAGWSADEGRTWDQVPLPFSECASPYYKQNVLHYTRT